MRINPPVQDYTQQNLPEGAKARIEIRKGDINYGLCNDIQFSPDGNRLAVASSVNEIRKNTRLELTVNNEIRIFTMGAREELKALIRPIEQQLSIAFSPDEKILASGSTDGAVSLWNVSNGTLLKTLIGHTRRVNSVAFNPDGKLLASGSDDNTICVWDIATSSHRKYELSGHVNSVAFSLDGKTLAVGASCHQMWMSDYTIQLWDVITGKSLKSQKVHVGGSGGWISRATFSPDIKTLVTQDLGPVIFLWNTEPASYKGELKGDRYRYGCSSTCVAFSPDGKTLASGGGTYPVDRNPLDQSSDNTVYLWDAVKCEPKTKFIGHTGIVNSVAFSPNGRILASGSQDGSVLLWDVDTVADKSIHVTIPIASSVPIPKIVGKDKTTLLEEKTKPQESESQIRQICTERGITTLLHFTQAENLRSILEEGLLGRSVLEEREQDFLSNDENRADWHPESVCLSISFPNYKLFYKYRKKTNDSQWVVLLLDARILWELDCAFCQENAARKTISTTPLEVRKGAEGLKGMFRDFYDIRHQDLPIPNPYLTHPKDAYPTHPQAEVLVLDSIGIQYIKAIHFSNETALEKWRSNYGNSQIFFVNQQYFHPRPDYKVWRPDNFNNKGIPLSYIAKNNVNIPLSASVDDDDIPF